MTDWTAGYVADIGYTFGYYNELNPLRAQLAFLNKGLVCPKFSTACELGFGQGLSTNIHAAGSSVEWYGTDFNPSQAGMAQEFAKAAGTGAKLYDQAFAEFCSRADLPDFDFIALHGIWSWISDDNRRVLVDFIHRKLKVGGVLYISYNTMPGWAAFAPMRHLMTQHAEVIGSEGRGIVSRIEGAVEFAEKLLDTEPLFAKANPLVADRIKKLKEQNRHYLAHEYFNKDWHPMHFATMADWLEPAKVSFACSAFYLDHIDAVNLTPAQQAFINEIPDEMLRQSVRDFMSNQQFRRDYWVKGPRPLAPMDKNQALRETRVVLVSHRPDVSLKVTGAVGEISLRDTIYNPLLDHLANHEVYSLGQLHAALSKDGIDFNQIVQAVIILVSGGHVLVVQDDAVAGKVKKQVEKLNTHLMNKARGGNDIVSLASPVTGGGITVGRFDQLFLLALSQGKKQPAEWAEWVWKIIAAHGQKLIKDGKSLEAPEDNLAELTNQAEQFAQKRLPAYKALKIA